MAEQYQEQQDQENESGLDLSEAWEFEQQIESDARDTALTACVTDSHLNLKEY
jgi:hypothetical protein